MATFIPQVQGNLPEVKLYTPPFEMIANFLDVKQQRYDAAATELGSYYSRLKQLPLTADSNVEKRDQFLKEAEAQVKRLAEVDLSLPENYKAARSIFTPLLEDQDIMTDLTFTLNAQAMSRANNAFRNSSEEEDRKRYNPNNDAYVSLKLNEFRMADSETRSAMAKQNFSFVNNVNLFQKYMDITKGMDFEIDTTKVPTTKSGVVMPFYVKTKNGKEITPNAYNKLARVFNSDPDVKAYYNQMGYINVQSELQSLIPEIGYEAALSQVANKYESTESIKKALQNAEEVKAEINSTEKKKEALEKKIRREGAVPGSNAHREYLQVLADLDSNLEEHKSLVEEAANLPLQANNLSELYSQAGSFFYQDDLQAAALDYATRNSGIQGIYATPNYDAWLESQSATGKGGEKKSSGTEDPGGLLSLGTGRISVIAGEPTKKSTSEVYHEKSVNDREAIDNSLVDIIATVAREANQANPSNQADIKFDGTGIRGAEDAMAWRSSLEGKSNENAEIKRVEGILESLNANGSLEELYPEAYRKYENYKQLKESYVNKQVALAGAYKNAVSSSMRVDGINDETAELRDLYQFVYDEKTGFKTKEQLQQSIAKAATEGTLPEALRRKISQTTYPGAQTVRTVSERVAEEMYLNRFSETDRLVDIKDDQGTVIGRETRWESLSDLQRDTYTKEINRAYLDYSRTSSAPSYAFPNGVSRQNIINPAELDGTTYQIGERVASLANQEISFSNQVSKWYDRVSKQVDTYFENDPKSKSLTKVFFPQAAPMNGAADALEILSSNLSIVPDSELGDREIIIKENLLTNLNRGLEENKVTISTGAFDQDKLENYTKGKISADKNDEQASYMIFTQFFQDMNRMDEAKTATSGSSPRATFKVLPNVPVEMKGGVDDNVSIIEVTFNTSYLNSITTTSDNLGLKQAANPGYTSATLFVPEEVAVNMDIPTSNDLESFNTLVANGQYTIQRGGNTVRLNYEELPDGTPQISYYNNITYLDENGKTRHLEGPGTDKAVVGTAFNFKLFKAELENKLEDIANSNTNIRRYYNEQNGGTTDPADLK